MATFNVTIASSLVPASKTDVPILVDLSDMPAAFWSTVTSGGGDIRCYESDGVTELAREVVSCNTGSSVGELWIKVSSVSASSDTVVKVVVDGTSSDYAVTDTYGRNAVWSDYVAVWHLNEDPNTAGASGIIDSTGNGHNGSPSGWAATGVVSSPWGATSGAIDFDGSNDYISVPDSASLELLVSGGVNYAVQFWGRPDAGDVDGFAVCKISEWGAYLTNATGDTKSPRFNTYGQNNLSQLSAENIVDETWQYYTFWGDPGTSFRTYVDAATVGNAAFTDTSAGSSNPLVIGSESASANRADGRLDEVRIATGSHADVIDNTDWQTIEYNNVVNIGTFYSIAAAGGGVTGSVPDSLTITDTTTNTATIVALASDSLALSDTSSVVGTFVGTVSDSIVVTDEAAGDLAGAITGAVPDAMSFTDTAAVTVNFVATASDSLGLTDTSSNTANRVAVSDDSLALDDLIGLTQALNVAVSDLLNLTETLTGGEVGEKVYCAYYTFMSSAETAVIAELNADDLIREAGLTDELAAYGFMSDSDTVRIAAISAADTVVAATLLC